MKHKTLPELEKVLIKFEKDYWVAPKGEDPQTRHILLHLTKLIGKLGAVCEKREHKFKADKGIIKTDVIPDLLYYSLSLSRIYKVDLEKTFMDRLEANKVKVKSWQK